MNYTVIIMSRYAMNYGCCIIEIQGGMNFLQLNTTDHLLCGACLNLSCEGRP